MLLTDSKSSTARRSPSVKSLGKKHRKNEKPKQNGKPLETPETILPLKKSSAKKDEEKTTQQLKTLAKRLQLYNEDKLKSRNEFEVLMRNSLPKEKTSDKTETEKSTAKTEDVKKSKNAVQVIEVPKPKFNVFTKLEAGEEPMKSSVPETKPKLTDSCTKALTKQEVVVKTKANERKLRVWRY